MTYSAAFNICARCNLQCSNGQHSHSISMLVTAADRAPSISKLICDASCGGSSNRRRGFISFRRHHCGEWAFRSVASIPLNTTSRALMASIENPFGRAPRPNRAGLYVSDTSVKGYGTFIHSPPSNSGLAAKTYAAFNSNISAAPAKRTDFIATPRNYNFRTLQAPSQSVEALPGGCSLPQPKAAGEGA